MHLLPNVEYLGHINNDIQPKRKWKQFRKIIVAKSLQTSFFATTMEG